MTNVEIKSISPRSVYRLFGGVGILVGVGLGIYLAMTHRLTIPQFLSNLRFLESMGPTGRILFLGGATGALYGVAVGVGSLALAVVYNFFSTLFGGVSITLDEEP